MDLILIKRRGLDICAAALFLLLSHSFLSAQASPVIVIKDSEIKPYRDAIKGFENTCGCQTRELESSDSDLFEKIQGTGAKAVFAVGTEAFRKAKEIKNLPVIYTLVMPSVALSASGPNVSGVSMNISPETYISTILRLFPGTKRIGIIFDPKRTGPFTVEAEAAGRARGITVISKKIENSRQAPVAMNELVKKIDLFWMLPDSTLVNSETVDYLMLFSFENKIPVFSFSKKYVETGAAAALMIDPEQLGEQSGELVKSILTHPEKGSVRVYARKPQLVINRKVVSKMGVDISDQILRQAEQVE